MTDEIKLKAMKKMASVTSVSLELQNMPPIFISHRKTVEKLLLRSFIKKRNYCLNEVIKSYLKRLNTRFWIFWEGHQVIFANLFTDSAD